MESTRSVGALFTFWTSISESLIFVMQATVGSRISPRSSLRLGNRNANEPIEGMSNKPLKNDAPKAARVLAVALYSQQTRG